MNKRILTALTVLILVASTAVTGPRPTTKNTWAPVVVAPTTP